MTDASANPAPRGATPWSGEPPVGRGVGWNVWLDAVEAEMARRGTHPSRVVVLVPYAQMMAAGRQAWVRQHGSGFAPRFESSRNWAGRLQPFVPGATDLTGDTARDTLLAEQWLDRVAGRSIGAALRAPLVRRLVEAARQLAPLAAAQDPAQRLAWADALRPTLTTGSPNLQWEGLVATLALTWVGHSAYATDVLWSDLAAPGAEADLLLVLPGFQTDPLAQALRRRWGERAALLPPPEVALGAGVPAGAAGPDESPTDAAGQGAVALHACGDAEDEAQRAAACVLAQIAGGGSPVALVAQDRLLTRRIGALLAGAGVSVRDETGWKLSTTHAAARLMSLLRAADRRARTDEVLDWLKQGPASPAVDALERLARRQGLALWSRVLAHSEARALVPAVALAVGERLSSPRSLVQWLTDLAETLQASGWWAACAHDAAGQRVIEVLRLQAGAAHELAELGAEAAEPGAAVRVRRWSLSAFTAWVREVLEAASFQPGSEGEAAVVVLPMAQLLGRDFAAVVVPGCDEVHVPTSPDPPGHWSEAQRAGLGLPGREALADAARAAWAMLLTRPRLALLWRTQHQGEAVSACAWVQALVGSSRARTEPDPRPWREVALETGEAAAPVVPDLLPGALSASAYQDLRDCPYRFFALRQLRLQTEDEIEAEPDKRDLGNWLHAVLKRFHETRAAHPQDGLDDRQRLDAVAQAEAVAQGLWVDPGDPGAGDTGAGFLPFMAAWPAMREGYLAWLAEHEASGPVFDQAEQSLNRQVGPWRLIGQLDRIDRQSSPEGPIPLVIDYKTEPRATTLARVKRPLEDTQIAFYAALLGDDTVRGAYLSITDSRETEGREPATRWIEQEALLLARDHLLDGIAQDLGRIAQGHALPALGEGQVCEFCAARGLCRKDFKA